MSSIVTTVLNSSIGWLVNKGRNIVAVKLKEGDVTDQKIRDLIVGDVEDIKSKLDGLSRQDLLAAVDFFETGIRYLFEALHVKPIGQVSDATAETKVKIAAENIDELSLANTVKAKVSVAAEMREKSENIDFDETTKLTFFEAEKRFQLAREMATKAFNNEALKIFDRITAIRYRIMATMLGSVAKTAGTIGDLSSSSAKIALENALPECYQCLQKLHSVRVVQSCFEVQMTKKGVLNLRGLFGTDERREIISSVCEVNRAIYNVTQEVGKEAHAWVWPCVCIDKDKVDLLSDGRVLQVMRDLNMEYCSVPWSFTLSQEGEEEHKLTFPRAIATNSHGYFLIVDGTDNDVKVFDGNGKYDFKFNAPHDDACIKIVDVEVDVDDQIYLLVCRRRPAAEQWEREVQILTKTADLQNMFPVKGGFSGMMRLIVDGSKVMVLVDNEVYVYEQNGEFLFRFGKGLLSCARDIASFDGRVIILDEEGLYSFSAKIDTWAHIFTMEGQYLDKFNVNTEGDIYYRIACHPISGHVVAAGITLDTIDLDRDLLTIALYTVNGDFVRRIQLNENQRSILSPVKGLAVTTKGDIAVALISIVNNYYNMKVIVL